jgi:hypothetical protein
VGLREGKLQETRQLHSEELYDLYPLLSIILMIKSRIRQAGHVTHGGEKRNTCRILVGKPEG